MFETIYQTTQCNIPKTWIFSNSL